MKASKRRKNHGTSKIVALGLLAVMIVAGIGASYYSYDMRYVQGQSGSIQTFSSCEEINNLFEAASNQNKFYGIMRGGVMDGGMQTLGGEAAPSAAPSYSETNIQVQGVDEADIVKTDGFFIYTLSKGELVIVKAYPESEAGVVSRFKAGDFSPQEMFIDGNMLLLFGTSSEEYEYQVPGGDVEQGFAKGEYYPYYRSFTTVKIIDISDKSNPTEVRDVDFEGYYVSARKIGTDVYFVIGTYPNFYPLLEGDGGNDVAIPSFRDSAESGELESVCGCADVKYFEPVVPESFITVASISMSDPNREIKKETVLGSARNVYASMDNLYVAQESYYSFMPLLPGEEMVEPEQKTYIYKFGLSNGDVSYSGSGEVSGSILNQFSMDEWDGHFRIATTMDQWSEQSTNNVYVLDSGMNVVGSLEGLASGEKIYSVRFMGEKGYVVTFKKIDPLFVIGLSDHANPAVLGKLKIPGYSDYLHPYDENHLIGIGKDTEEAEDPNNNFAWYQGIKMAIFDVTDVNNPIEMHKVVIGDRGTDSPILQDHKAFLFDKEKGLLVIPVLYAEIADKHIAEPNSYGDYTFQGSYVYSIDLENGFDLKGTVTHVDDPELFKKSGYYFWGDGYSIERNLFIEDLLYSISQNMIKINQISDLMELKKIEIN